MTVYWHGSAVPSALCSSYSLCAGSLLVRERDLHYVYINNSEIKTNGTLVLFFQVPTGFTPYILPTMFPPALETTVTKPCICLHFGLTIYAFFVCS